jgi:hypothetical protein
MNADRNELNRDQRLSARSAAKIFALAAGSGRRRQNGGVNEPLMNADER